MANCVLGIDCGGTAAKVALFDADGRLIGARSTRIEMMSPAPGHTERDAEAMWQGAAAAIRTLFAETGVPPGEVAGVAATGHGNGLYLVDADGHAIRPGINSTDTRAAGIVSALAASGRLPAVRAKSLQSLWAGQPEVLLAWLAENEPETLARASAALMCKDFIRFRLTGEAALETTDMSTTNLMEVRAGAFDDGLFEAFGIARFRPLFGTLLRPEAIAGHVTPIAARDTGLLAGTPVAAGAIDIVASALGAGAIDPSRAAVVAGTWSINEHVIPAPVERDELFMVSRFAGDAFLAVEASACSAGNLEWFLDHVIAAGAVAPEDRGRLYGEANAMAERVAPDAANVLFLPYFFGSRDSGHARGTIAGLTSFHTADHLVRAVYEGVAFEHRAHLERLHGEGAGSPTAIRLTGGVTKSPIWTRIFTDVVGMPVEVPETGEAGALGAAMLAAIATGLVPDIAAAARRMVRVRQVLEPGPEAQAIYEAQYARNRRLAAALTPFWSGGG